MRDAARVLLLWSRPLSRNDIRIVLSIGTVGCNVHCKHCQGSDISQYPHEHGGEIVDQDGIGM